MASVTTYNQSLQYSNRRETLEGRRKEQNRFERMIPENSHKLTEREDLKSEEEDANGMPLKHFVGDLNGEQLTGKDELISVKIEVDADGMPPQRVGGDLRYQEEDADSTQDRKQIDEKLMRSVNVDGDSMPLGGNLKENADKFELTSEFKSGTPEHPTPTQLVVREEMAKRDDQLESDRVYLISSQGAAILIRKSAMEECEEIVVGDNTTIGFPEIRTEALEFIVHYLESSKEEQAIIEATFESNYTDTVHLLQGALEIGIPQLVRFLQSQILPTEERLW